MLNELGHYLERGITKGSKKETTDKINNILSKIADGLARKSETEIKNILAEKEKAFFFVPFPFPFPLFLNPEKSIFF
jgi:hypothetical protein